MRKFLLTLTALAVVLCSVAQERPVTGTVTSQDDGSRLPGVNVVVKGTTAGTVTDSDGNYSVSAQPGATLVFSFIGFVTREEPVGDRTAIDVALSSDTQQLNEVVVTAQGISKEQKTLGYAQTTIGSERLANKPETDIGRALQGRTPGLQILNSSGLAGSGTKINIRGNSSITGDTQPLWVVNGVPINTDSRDINLDFRDGQVAPTRFLDIDPNNIESISVLRGLSATTLYGSQGRNGVILVTTKTGSASAQQNAFEGSVTQSYFVVEAFVPEYHNKWANGFDGAYGEFFSNWGSLFDGKPTGQNHPYYEWRETFPEFPEFAQSGDDAGGYIPKAYPNNVADFFQKGHSSTTSLTLGTSSQSGSLNFSYSHLDEEGFVLNNNLQRDNFSLGGSSKLTRKLTFTGTFNFVRTDMETPPSGAGSGSNSDGGPSVFAEIFYTPRNIDLSRWPWEDPVKHSSVYYRNNNSITNPYWLLHNTRQTNLTNRFFSSSSLNYKINDWFNLTYRLGWDTFSEKQTYWLNKGASSSFDENLLPGAYRSTTGISNIFDNTFMGAFNKELNDQVSLSAVVGFNDRRNTYSQEGLESLGQVVYGLIEHRNFTSTQPKDFRGNHLNFQENSRITGVYFDGNIGYRDMLFVNITGRNDWSSTLEKAHRSQFYPGGSVAFLPTTAFPSFGGDVLDFLKVRVGYGSSANFPPPYSTRPSLTLNSQNRIDRIGNVVTLRLPVLLANPDLQPELLTETEFGIESQLFGSRVGLNLSYYSKLSKDQIIQRDLDPATGYSATYINAGEISNKGIEMLITLVPLKTSDWTFEVTANYTKNVSKVESLPEGSKEILISGYTNIGNFAIEGEPYNVIKGSYTERAPDGQLIVNSAGNYKQANEIGIIGNPNPKWMGSLITNLTWKGISFGMQWDYVHGGQVLSYTAATMVGRGVAKDLESFDPTLPLILPGVLEVTDEDGTVTGYKPNNIPVTTAGVFFDNTIIGTSPYDRGIYDATRVRFREISLGYNLPATISSKMKMRNVNISLIGSNLWYRAVNSPKYAKADFDRTAFGTANGAGFDYLGGPSAKRYGVNVRFNF